MQLILGEDEQIAVWVMRKIGKSGDIGPHSAFGIADDGGRLVGGVVFSDYRDGQVEASWAFDDPRIATQRRLWRFFHQYCTETLKVRRVTARCSESNKRTQRLTEFLGFRPEGRLRKGWSEDEDAILFGALSSEWRFQHGHV